LLFSGYRVLALKDEKSCGHGWYYESI
jgi:hypothetical protein